MEVTNGTSARDATDDVLRPIGDPYPEDDPPVPRKRFTNLKVNSLGGRTIYANELKMKKQQLQDAVKYCRDHACRGGLALKTGLFPRVKDKRTVNRILDGAQIDDKRHLRIMTTQEELLVVDFIKNSNRALQPVNRADITKVILDILNGRKVILRKTKFRAGILKLSTSAENCLKTGKVGRSFWLRFDAEHQDLKKKRCGVTAMKRALACTREMAVNHLDELAYELIDAGIFVEAIQLEPGKWTGKLDTARVFNTDETPQFMNYGVDPTSHNIYYAGSGEECSRLVKENRECATIDPTVSVAGEVVQCHVIFTANSITSQMVPREAVNKISDLLVSASKSGYQDGKTCLSSYKLFDKYLTRNNIKRPVVMLTDGHGSRFNVDVLRFCRDKQIRQFVSPPDTTSTTQLLDQVNQVLHSAYRNEIKDIIMDEHINKRVFMLVLSEIWDSWTSREMLIKAAKRVGISSDGLNVDWMQQDKFRAAELLLGQASEAAEGASAHIDSPFAKKGTKEYYKLKCDIYEKELKRLNCSMEIPEEQIQRLMKPRIRKFQPTNTKNSRLLNDFGSLEGKDALQKALEIEERETQKTQTKDAKDELRNTQTEAFIRCKEQCVCDNTPCSAINLKRCPSCKEVKRSVCSKFKCLSTTGTKPVMLLPAAQLQLKSNKGSKRMKVDEVYSDKSSSDEDDIESIQSDHEEDTVSSSVRLDVDDVNEFVDADDPEELLIEIWESISNKPEVAVVGQWYAAVYAIPHTGKSLLCIGRALRRFLRDENGKASELLLDCLKPRVGRNQLIEEYPEGQTDQYMCRVSDIIGGPIRVIPKGRKWHIPEYDKLMQFYNCVKNIRRENIAF